MSGCWTCGGYGSKHDPVAHGWQDHCENAEEEYIEPGGLMRDIIYGILIKHYGRMYDYALCDAMTEWIADRINSGEFMTCGDIMFYIWMNTSGGGVAEESATEIQRAFPDLILPTMYRSYKGQVD